MTDDVIGLVPLSEGRMDSAERTFVRSNEAGPEPYDDGTDVQEIRSLMQGVKVDIEKNVPDLDDLAVDDAVGLYLKETVSAPLLSFEEEIELAKAVCKGREAQRKLKESRLDPEKQKRLKQDVREARLARERLILANTRLVVSIAKRYRGHGLSFLDLIQEGNLGLMKTVERYDYTRGYRFSTYATWWIRQSITRALACQGRTIRIPVHMNARIRHLYKVSRRLEQAYDRRPTPEEIAQEMGLKPCKVRWMLKVSRYPLSLEQPVGEDGDSELRAFIEDGSTPVPTESADQHLMRDEVEKALNTLTPREARILRLRFGLQNGHSYTLEEVGQKFGLTRERIRQIEAKALRRLRHPRRSRQLRGYLA